MREGQTSVPVALKSGIDIHKECVCGGLSVTYDRERAALTIPAISIWS